MQDLHSACRTSAWGRATVGGREGGGSIPAEVLGSIPAEVLHAGPLPESTLRPPGLPRWRSPRRRSCMQDLRPACKTSALGCATVGGREGEGSISAEVLHAGSPLDMQDLCLGPHHRGWPGGRRVNSRNRPSTLSAARGGMALGGGRACFPFFNNFSFFFLINKNL